MEGQQGRRALGVAVLVAGMACALPAPAQEYPVKVVRLVVPFPTGGPTDPPARAIAAGLTEVFGQQVIVDFRGGAAGNIGTEHVARSAPDGYTLVLVTSSFILAPVTQSKPPFDPIRDFAPISLVSRGPVVLVVNPSVPVRSVKELIALARKHPGKLTFASSGTGGPLHLYGELLKTLTKIDMLHVPFKGAGPAVVDVVAGHVDLMFVALPAVVPHMKAGRVRALAVGSQQRASALPDLPTVEESGVKGFEGSSRYGILAPAGTPGSIVARLNATLGKVMATRAIKERFEGYGLEPEHSAPEAFGAYLREQIARWTSVARAAGVRPDSGG